ncbi:MAG: hypothetical protein RLY17_1333 [Pseudomonadota bacterium]|jgi:hypothetical protein
MSFTTLNTRPKSKGIFIFNYEVYHRYVVLMINFTLGAVV